MHQALFVISTGRCGTQWLAHALQLHCGDGAEVTHEPIHSAYAARRMLAAREPENLDHETAAPILAHLDRIEEILQSRAYIECGHPLWSTLPYLLRRFAGRMRVVHLIRHPVHTAWSWLAQRAYCPPLAPHLSVKEPLSAFDEGIAHGAYRTAWTGLSPYEKALFYWLEVNAFAQRLEQRSNAPWLRMRFEELFSVAALQALLVFAGMDASAVAQVPARVDNHPFLAGSWSDSALIARHPDVIRLAELFGYDALSFDDTQLRQRHLGDAETTRGNW